MEALKILVTTALVVLVFTLDGEAQKLMGVVSQKSSRGLEEAVPGANVHWLGTGVATTTAANGVFMIARPEDANKLVISFTGLQSDTVTVTDQTSIRVELKPERVLKAVTIEGWKPTSGMDHGRSMNTNVMLEEELFKAACCNLAESFETNPSVDIAFTDAMTGTRSIKRSVRAARRPSS